MRKYTTLPFEEYPVAPGNYGEFRAPKIEMIILHHTATNFTTAINWFGNPNAGTSAHYVVSNKGEIAAMLEEYWTAYHSGNLDVNKKSIGIETEWYEGLIRNEVLYETVIKLVADICKYHNITPSTATIKGHREIVPTACPGSLDINKIIEGVKKVLSSPVPIVTPDNTAELKQKILDLQATELRLQKEKDEIRKELEKKLLTQEVEIKAECELKCQALREEHKSIQDVWIKQREEYQKKVIELEQKPPVEIEKIIYRRPTYKKLEWLAVLIDAANK